MKIALGQMNVIPGRPHKNLDTMLRMIEAAKCQKVDLIAFPELCISGYLLGDKWRDEQFCENMMEFNKDLLGASDGIAIAYGNIFLDKDVNARLKHNNWHPNKDGTMRKYNAVYVVQNKKPAKRLHEHPFLPKGVHVKTLHPNYRIFDDERYFFSLQDVAKDLGFSVSVLEQPFLIDVNGQGVPVGFEVCEDLWCEDYRLRGETLNPTKMLIDNGAEHIINISASPWTFGKNAARDKRIAFLKQESGEKFVPFSYVNCTGVQNNGKNFVTFDGGSTVYNSDGKPIRFAREAYGEEVVIVDDFSIPAIERDEKPKIAQKLEAIIQGIRHLSDIRGVDQLPRFVIGMSGGIDSAVSAALLTLAVGPGSVIGVNMPTTFNSKKTQDTAKYVADQLGIQYMTVPIEHVSNVVKNVLENLPITGGDKPLTAIQYGNVMAKIRGTDMLSNIAAKLGALFTNNANKLELALGYATLYGDVNGAVAPLADLTKTEVVEMARYLNTLFGKEVIPEVLLPDKLFRFRDDQIYPSAELEDNQKDPMKFGYHCALLEAYTDFKRKAPEDIMQWYLEGTLEQNLKLPKGMIGRWKIDDPKEFMKDLEWFTKTIDWSIFKRVQGPPIIILEKCSYGYDIRESMLPYEALERTESTRYKALKEKVLAVSKYTSSL